MPGKGKCKGKKGGRRLPYREASRDLRHLLMPTRGERCPGAEAEGWYNDFQSSESDSVDFNYPAERPSLILASLQGSSTREEPTGQFWAGPVCGPGTDSAESYGDQPDYENRHSEVDSAGCYDPYREDYKGYAGYGERGECSDVSLRSDMGSDTEGDTPMEVEEDPHRDLPSHSDANSSSIDEPPAPKPPPKAPPRVRRPGASKLSWVASREAASSEEDTLLPMVKGPTAHASTPKPRGGKKAVTPVPTPEPGSMAGALRGTHAPKS
ncbi:hypothetical protein P4O66_001658 [Electrophorus voltai]|uniref:Uncharacterized protein n=1 Tax=Electrophorus voltai TaxID=2609070 RepID=A0AAD9DRW2_9TELE|nr:hypothetical protein P4O66_001658 [Electrophorus voltai]